MPESTVRPARHGPAEQGIDDRQFGDQVIAHQNQFQVPLLIGDHRAGIDLASRP